MEVGTDEKDLIGAIVEAQKVLGAVKKDQKLYGNDGAVYDLLAGMYELYWEQIHSYLVRQNTVIGEQEIRTHIKNILRQRIIEMCVDKAVNSTDLELGGKFAKLTKDYYALVAFRSLEHWALFYEWDFEDKDKVWKFTMKNMRGYFHYANKTIFDRSIRFLSKQMATGTGKCLDENTLVLTPKGSKKIKDIEIGDKVYSMSGNELVVEQVTNKWQSFKPYYLIKMKNGVELKASPDHRMFTQRGYVRAEDLRGDDYFYQVNSKIKFDKNKINEDELIFVACMIFDGHCEHPFFFTKRKSKILDEFLGACDRLGFKYSCAIDKKSKCVEVNVLRNNHRPKAILEKYGVYGCLSKHKRLPKQFFTMPIGQRLKFVGIMIATDGYIPKGCGQCGVALSSKELVYDIQELLSSCRIPSSIYEKTVKLNNKEFDNWVLNISEEYFEKLASCCDFYDKNENALLRISKNSVKKTKPYSNRNNYPKELFLDQPEFRKLVKKQWNRNKTFKQEIVEMFNNKTGLLSHIVYKDFIYSQIKEITYCEDKIDMYDIEVSGTHNFIANGFVSHNSYSDALTIAWILGYDKNARIIKMVGNPSLLDEVFPSISGIMTSKQFAKVFPYFRQFHEMGGRIEDKMFKIYKSADGVFSLVGSSAPLNFSLYSKQTKISGKRTDFLFLDDITQLEDAGNMRQHGKDLNQYHNVWYKRNANEKDFVVFAGGTTYSLYDILSTLKREHSDGGVKPSPFKYTVTNQDETAIFTVVPKLDYDTDESTYPEKFPTSMARKLREKDFRTFMAMEQQTPLPPDGTPFYWDNLQLYDSLLPREEGDACYACLDPARTGKNYVAMGIHRKIEILPNSGVYKHYLVDCIYQLKTMDELYQEIVEKIKKHNIRKLLVEKNTDTSLKALLEKMLTEQGINYCEIDEIYTYKVKGDKIYNAESLIRNNIIFPAQSLYSNTSQMGKFMEHIVTYSYKDSNDYDDSIDCEAMYAEKFTNDVKKSNKAELLYRRKPRYGF